MSDDRGMPGHTGEEMALRMAKNTKTPEGSAPSPKGREERSRSEAHRELVDYLVTHMTDAWEGHSQRDRAWMAGVIEEVLFLLYHAEDLEVLERAMGERFVAWWKSLLERLRTHSPEEPVGYVAIGAGGSRRFDTEDEAVDWAITESRSLSHALPDSDARVLVLTVIKETFIGQPLDGDGGS